MHCDVKLIITKNPLPGEPDKSRRGAVLAGRPWIGAKTVPEIAADGERLTKTSLAIEGFRIPPSKR